MKNSKSALEAIVLEVGFDVGPAIRRGVRATLVAMAVLFETPPFAGAVSILSGEAYSPVLWGPAQESTDIVEYAVDVTSTGMSGDHGYLNVVQDDGTWVVWNLAVGLEPGTRTIATQVAASLFQSGGSYQTTIDPTIRATAPTYAGGTSRTLGTPVSYQQDNPWGVTEFGPLGRPTVPPHEPPPFVFPDPFPWVWHADMPDTPQGHNQCGPSAAANSLSWLDHKYRWGLGPVGDIRSALVELMQTDLATGTTLPEFLLGKKRYVTNPLSPLPLYPIETHEIPPGLENIEAEMKKKQDVELFIEDLTGSGGHIVTLVGIQYFGPGEGAQIAYVDPGDRKNQIQEAWVTPNGVISTGAYTLWEIRHAVAESVTPLTPIGSLHNPGSQGEYASLGLYDDGVNLVLANGTIASGETVEWDIPLVADEEALAYQVTYQSSTSSQRGDVTLAFLGDDNGTPSRRPLGFMMNRMIGVDQFLAPMLEGPNNNLYVAIDLTQWLGLEGSFMVGNSYPFVNGVSSGLPGVYAGTSPIAYNAASGAFDVPDPYTGPTTAFAFVDGHVKIPEPASSLLLLFGLGVLSVLSAWRHGNNGSERFIRIS